jgi:hypothetical protein
VIEVEQRLFYDAATGQRGDCLKCCVASLLELDYDAVPHFAQMDDWYGAYMTFLHERGWGTFPIPNLGNCDADPSKPSSWPHLGYWIAAVWSPRIILPDGGAGTHAIVMYEEKVAWDPHPQRDGGHGGFISGTILRALDPGRFVLKDAA